MYELQKRHQLLKSSIMYQYVNCIDYINKQDGSNEPNQRLMIYNDNNNNNKAFVLEQFRWV